MVSIIKKHILSWLLHRANRQTKSKEFYLIKDRILRRHGTIIGYDVQFIEGKKCHSCHGTGIYRGNNEYSGKDYTDVCWRCNNGWYKLPVWNTLYRIRFGKYIFHRPYMRAYKAPEINQPLIQGYIEHTEAKYGALALFILCLIYEKGYLKRYWNTAGYGLRVYWWQPQNYANNIIHLIKYRRNAVPFLYYKRKKIKPIKYEPCHDDLPF